MRVLFFGTSEFAVPTLAALIGDDRFEVVAAVTQPDRPRGRGKGPGESPVKRAALQHGLPIMQPERVRAPEFVQLATSLRPDVIALAAFGQIVPRSLLELPPLGPVNVHGSLLPSYRGAAPIQRCLMAGETETGVTTMWMEPTLDTGDILLSAAVRILPEDTAGTLSERMAAIGAGLLVDTLLALERGDCPRVRQDSSLATYAPAITQVDCRVDWTHSAAQIHNRIRGLSPAPGCTTLFAGKRVKLWAVVPHPGGTWASTGQILSIAATGVRVTTGEGVLELVEVQPESSRRMAAVEWARGARLAPGDEFREDM